jgi:hypothetical protein
VRRRGAIACIAGAALALAALPALADERSEFWPELDGYFTLSERTRLFVATALTLAEETQSAAGSTQYQDVQVGVHLDVTLDPLLRPALSLGDWQRNRYLWMRIGYRYGRSLDDAETTDRFRENRGIFELTGRTPPLAGGIEVITRFRWDARDVDDRYSNRYRLRLQVEKSLSLGGRAVVPFANAETFYDTRFDTWNRQRYQLGAELELNRTWRLEPSLIRQNDNRSEPARINAFGLALKYFH